MSEPGRDVQEPAPEALQAGRDVDAGVGPQRVRGADEWERNLAAMFLSMVADASASASVPITEIFTRRKKRSRMMFSNWRASREPPNAATLWRYLQKEGDPT